MPIQQRVAVAHPPRGSHPRTLERLGMRREMHTVRDSLHLSGEWLDGFGYALLADEWVDG